LNVVVPEFGRQTLAVVGLTLYTVGGAVTLTDTLLVAEHPVLVFVSRTLTFPPLVPAVTVICGVP